jgi:hypothetical protein
MRCRVNKMSQRHSSNNTRLRTPRQSPSEPFRLKQSQPGLSQDELPITWQHYDRLPSGDYPAYSCHSRIYFDRAYKRWVLLVLFDVLDDSLCAAIARVPWFLNLGTRDKPHVSRRSKAFVAWCDAIGHAPKRIDRPSARVFIRRYAIVTLDDTTHDYRGVCNSDLAYSVVRGVRWNTSGPDMPIISQASPASNCLRITS